jgi:hypothetical protein
MEASLLDAEHRDVAVAPSGAQRNSGGCPPPDVGSGLGIPVQDATNVLSPTGRGAETAKIRHVAGGTPCASIVAVSTCDRPG